MSETLRIKMLDYIVRNPLTDFEGVMAFIDVINKDYDIVELNMEFQKIIRNR